jgi:very-short-patch-repair endonuclease
MDQIVSGCAGRYSTIENALNRLRDLGYVVCKNNYWFLTGKDWEATKQMKKIAAAAMRRNPTPQEEVLWSKLKRKQLGYSFARQKKLYGYIADFYCAELKLVIEVDGKCHDFSKIYDGKRDEVMKEHGNGVLRIKNEDADSRLDYVIELIKKAILLCEKRRERHRSEKRRRISSLAEVYSRLNDVFEAW